MMEFAIEFKHAVIEVGIFMPIVPIGEADVRRNPIHHLFGSVEIFNVDFIQIMAIIRQTNEHIAPHMAVKIIFFGYFSHAFQMTGDDFALLFVTIFPEMLPISKVIGFIHSNIEVFRSKASPDIGD